MLIYMLEMRKNGNKIKWVYLQNYSYHNCLYSETTIFGTALKLRHFTSLNSHYVKLANFKID